MKPAPQYFLQKLFGRTISNENEVKANVEAIDLIDHENKLLIQISNFQEAAQKTQHVQNKMKSENNTIKHD